MTVDLRLGDCLEILPTLAEKSVDAIITDIPYGTTACKWDVIIPLEPMWEQVKRLCKGAFVTTASQPFTSVLVCSNLDWFKYEWKWHKKYVTNPFLVKVQPIKKFEDVCVFSENGHTYNPQMIKRPDKWMRKKPSYKGRVGEVFGGNHKPYPNSADREFMYPSNFLDIPIEHPSTRRAQHPTQKPVALYEYLIRTYTNKGDTVMDFCMGSGTTGVACVKTGRNFIGIEKESNYFAIAERRIKEAQQQIVMEFA